MSSNVSVIIPCFNGGRFLNETIRSVIEQSQQACEILVIDDGSTDTTKEIATSFPEVRYLYHQNHGVSFSRNRGLNECIGEYVIFLDADDMLPVDRIKNDNKFLDENRDIGYVFGRFDVIDEYSCVKENDKPDNIFDAGYHTVLAGNATVPPGAVTFRTKFLRQVNGGFDAEIHASEDFDLYLRFSRVFPIYCSNRVSLYYRRHQNNCSSFNGGLNTLTSMLNLLEGQKKFTTGNAYLVRELRAGVKHWKALLGPGIVGEFIVALKLSQWKQAMIILIFLLKNCPFLLFKTLYQKIISRRRLFSE